MRPLYRKLLTINMVMFALLLQYQNFDYAEKPTKAEIDILFLYTEEGDTEYGLSYIQNKANHTIQVANETLAESGLGNEFIYKVVGFEKVNNYNVSTLSGSDRMSKAINDMAEQMSFGDFFGAGPLTPFDKKRYELGADIVVLLTPVVSETAGTTFGIAYLNGYDTKFEKYDYLTALSVVAFDHNVDWVLAHELGHVLSLSHSKINTAASSGGAFDHGRGYGVSGKFATIMAYPHLYNLDFDNSVYLYSSTSLTCENLTCGKDKDATDGADAVHVLKNVGWAAANFADKPENLKPAKIESLTGLNSNGEFIGNGYLSHMYVEISGSNPIFVFVERKISGAWKIVDVYTEAATSPYHGNTIIRFKQPEADWPYEAQYEPGEYRIKAYNYENKNSPSLSKTFQYTINNAFPYMAGEGTSTNPYVRGNMQGVNSDGKPFGKINRSITSRLWEPQL